MTAPGELSRVMRGDFSAYIREETLSERLEAGPPPEGAKAETAKIEGREITLSVRRVTGGFFNGRGRRGFAEGAEFFG